jgi:hypothetical protein
VSAMRERNATCTRQAQPCAKATPLPGKGRQALRLQHGDNVAQHVDDEQNEALGQLVEQQEAGVADEGRAIVSI